MIEAMKDFESKEAIAIARTESDTEDSTSGKAPSGPSLAICLFIFLLYAIAFTLAIPAFPILLLNVTGGRSDLSSFYYGSASCIKYLLEFFSSPFLGSLSDTYGRKKLLIFSLSVVCVELFMFAIYPSVGTLYLGSILSGLGNASNTIGHAIVTDISNNRREPAAKNFGYFGAVFGLGFIMGPLCGSLLVARNLQLCFVVAGSMAVLALIVTVVFFTESCLVFQSYDAAKSNPISSLRKFFANADLRQLSVPFMLSNFCTGIYFIWILYMNHRFQASTMQVGAFLSLSGLCGVIVQGVLVPRTVPNLIRTDHAVLTGLALSGTQLLLYGSSPSLAMFFVVLLVFSPSLMYGPALKALLADAAGPDQQGALQGALGSLRTLTAGLGSLFFTGAFSMSVSQLKPHVPGLPFFLAAGIYLFSFLYTRRYFDDVRNPRNEEAVPRSSYNVDVGNEIDGELGAEELPKELKISNRTPLLVSFTPAHHNNKNLNNLKTNNRNTNTSSPSRSQRKGQENGSGMRHGNGKVSSSANGSTTLSMA